MELIRRITAIAVYLWIINIVTDIILTYIFIGG